MFFAIRGKIFTIEPTRLLLDNSGVIYEISISLTTYSALSDKDEVFVFLSEVIREDAHLLFGFSEELEKNLFDRLIKINGVGPKVALAILSTYQAKDFLDIICKQDVASLQKVSGIGAKSAGKIMVDLSGFYVQSQEVKIEQKSHIEARMALESLGFKANAINKVLKDISLTNTQEVIKEALRLLK